jgi:hypothetical protein
MIPDLRNSDSGNWDKKWATSEIVRFCYFVPLNNEIQAVLFFNRLSASMFGTKLNRAIGGNGSLGLVFEN